MPADELFPGVPVEELTPGARAIPGVPTAVTAFVGRARRGPVDTPVAISGVSGFERRFGGPWSESSLPQAVSLFFANGGTRAVVVRLHHASAPGARDRSSVTLPAAAGGALELEASDPGVWGDRLRVSIRHEDGGVSFLLTVQEIDESLPPRVVAEESFAGLTVAAAGDRDVGRVLQAQSALLRLAGPVPAGIPDETASAVALAGGSDGDPISDEDVVRGDRAAGHGLSALEDADFNLLCIPPLGPDDVAPSTWDAAAAYCAGRRAVVLVDPPASWGDVDAVLAGLSDHVAPHPNAVLYVPRLRVPDPGRPGHALEVAPCGAVAGVIARTDAARGVWKAPAGLDADLRGAVGLTFALDGGQVGVLNPRGINCLRSFPGAGPVVWGARTLAGDDARASEWKYLPVRRTALFIEKSLEDGLRWAAFEPNGEGLWAQVRLVVGDFLQDLFRSGALLGNSPREAWFVRCDASTTTEADLAEGLVNVLVGVALLKPAEFTVLTVRLRAQPATH